jgi:AAA domain
MIRWVWRYTRVPEALSRRVNRRNYLGTVLAESTRAGVAKLDIYAPRLLPAKGAESIESLQAAWEKINGKGRVRVITLDLEEGLQAGAELSERGIEVRVLPNERCLGSDTLTFHIFGTSAPEDSVAIINDHRGGADWPMRYKGMPLIEVLRARFRAEWENARPLESVIAERIQPRSSFPQGGGVIAASIEQADATGLRLGVHTRKSVLSHLAFRDCSRYIFIVGLPGAGKSYVRSRLAEELVGLRIGCRSISDYPYAYADFLRSALKLNGMSLAGFKSHEQGAFAVQSERILVPALRAVSATLLDSSQAQDVTLIEFARADIAAALREFDDIRTRSQVIYVSAPEELRAQRLANRVVPPEIRIDDQTITVGLSDNHLLPGGAARALYGSDNADEVRGSAQWDVRFFEIDNSSDDDALVTKKIEEFTNSIICRYRDPRP